ncbi:hypothetical protein HPB51_021199 [Rhipicephalus microplus]|uniref:Uncharacterized protein n=1 Tax=Rhipicephalus microplus TaxID=6941 RepID=A0A9J6F602_RHIMP|nr:hypothetical protein HPB51_021199 [Rhipicephalus microplus]
MADDISEDICDDWEDMVENGVLEKKLERLKVKTNSANSNNANPPSSGGGEVAVMPRVLLEDSVRTQYTPAVKILKRPPDASRSGWQCERHGSREVAHPATRQELTAAGSRVRRGEAADTGLGSQRRRRPEGQVIRCKCLKPRGDRPTASPYSATSWPRSGIQWLPAATEVAPALDAAALDSTPRVTLAPHPPITDSPTSCVLHTS